MTPRLNCLFFVQNLGTGGVLRQLGMLASGLRQRGHRIQLLGLFESDPHWRRFWDPLCPVLPPLLPELPTRPSSLLRAGFVSSRLRAIFAREAVEVVYAAQGHLARWCAFLATRGASRPALVWGARGNAEATPGWKQMLPYVLCAATSSRVPLLISNSQAGLERRRRHGFRCRRQLIIRNAVDGSRFRPDPGAHDRIRQAWGVGDETLIGVVAGLRPSKGHATFLEAMARLAKSDATVRFVLVGDGPPARRRELERRIRELGLGSRCIWAGLRRDMPEVYNAFDLFCSASLSEGSSNAVAEAMATGVPCVVTDAGDSAILVGELGPVVPPGDAGRLADALARAIHDLPERDPGRWRGRIINLLSPETLVAETERALLSVAANVRR